MTWPERYANKLSRLNASINPCFTEGRATACGTLEIYRIFVRYQQRRRALRRLPKTRMEIMSKLVDAYLNQYGDWLEVSACLIEVGAIVSCYALLQGHLVAGHWLLALDAHIWRAAGTKNEAELDW